jgi:hypothetical protein
MLLLATAAHCIIITKTEHISIAYLLPSLHFLNLSTNRENLKHILYCSSKHPEKQLLLKTKRTSFHKTARAGILRTSPIRYRSNLTADLGNKTPPDDFCSIRHFIHQHDSLKQIIHELLIYAMQDSWQPLLIKYQITTNQLAVQVVWSLFEFLFFYFLFFFRIHAQQNKYHGLKSLNDQCPKICCFSILPFLY